LPHPVHGEYRCLTIRRREERARRVGLVVLAPEHLALVAAESLPDGALQLQPWTRPERCGCEKGAESARRGIHPALEQPVELEQRLVVECHRIQIADRDAGARETPCSRPLREALVALNPREPLFLRRRDDLTVAHQARR